MIAILSRVLWVDCLGAAIAGVTMLTLSGWLSLLYTLPHEFVIGLGLVNLSYAGFSFSLAIRTKRPQALITLLVAANASWAGVCLLAAIALAAKASPFGLAHLVIESLYVGGLAKVEWSQRDRLLTAS